MKTRKGMRIANIQLNFSQPKKVFPCKYTKIRMPTDLMNLVEKKGKYMKGKEIFKIKNVLENWDEKDFEVYAKRDKKGVKLIPFDIEE